jgi:uncharacterized protein (DUF2249 family)
MKAVKPIRLDVREDIQRGREPFSRIMQTVASLEPDQGLLLIAPFEPKPLCGLLQARGFTWSSHPLENGDWEVLFTPGQAETGTASPPVSRPPCSKTLEVDARGLQPPEPMVKILDALVELPPGTDLLARTDRKPMQLYPRLQERGFTGETNQLEDGSYITRISRS